MGFLALLLLNLKKKVLNAKKSSFVPLEGARNVSIKKIM